VATRRLFRASVFQFLGCDQCKNSRRQPTFISPSDAAPGGIGLIGEMRLRLSEANGSTGMRYSIDSWGGEPKGVRPVLVRAVASRVPALNGRAPMAVRFRRESGHLTSLWRSEGGKVRAVRAVPPSELHCHRQENYQGVMVLLHAARTIHGASWGYGCTETLRDS
jgi:hypothetical protein